MFQENWPIDPRVSEPQVMNQGESHQGGNGANVAHAPKDTVNTLVNTVACHMDENPNSYAAVPESMHADQQGAQLPMQQGHAFAQQDQASLKNKNLENCATLPEYMHADQDGLQVPTQRAVAAFQQGRTNFI